MAALPDPSTSLSGEDLAVFRHMAEVRAHSDGRAALGEVYVRMFNNPGVASAVGALGEHLRFHGTLPDDVREIVILRYAARAGYPYELAHHVRPATLAGVSRGVIDAVIAGAIPGDLADASRAAIEAVDAVVARRSIPADVQARVVAAHGNAGIVEIVALCGLYGLMGAMVTAFDIPIEKDLPGHTA